MPKLLVVDDDERLCKLIERYAIEDGYECSVARDGDEALSAIDAGGVDIVVLDVMMPGRDGFEVLAEMRRTSDVPVIMLSARGEEYDRLHGFGLGADDYVAKPFSPRELMARVAAVLRRSGAIEDRSVFGPLSIDARARIAKLDGRPLALSPKELDLLLFFSKNAGAALDRERILKNVWGSDWYGDSRTVDTHVKSLRDALGEHRGMIATIWGIGYRFEPEDES